MIGEVSRAHVFPAHVASAFCRFRVLTGPGWVLLDGAPGGQTQAAVVDRSAQPFLAAEGGTAEFGHPLDVHFGATSVSGWPQLEVTVWGQDGLSRNEICACGRGAASGARGRGAAGAGEGSGGRPAARTRRAVPRAAAARRGRRPRPQTPPDPFAAGLAAAPRLPAPARVRPAVLSRAPG